MKGVILVTLLFLISFFIARSYKAYLVENKSDSFSEFLALPEFNVNDSMHRQLLKEALNSFYPEQIEKNEKTANELERYVVEKFTNPLFKEGADRGFLTFGKIPDIILRFIPFVIIFLLVLGITYYGAVTLGTIKYLNYKKKSESVVLTLFDFIKSEINRNNFFRDKKFWQKLLTYSGLIIIKMFGYLVLFSPAYVAAYAMRTKIDTDTYPFLILLAVFTNGILINYINKFYTFLLHEGNKGYVETALVKNLDEDYNNEKYFSTKLLFKIQKKFDGHVFGHIYKNAEFQFVQGIKDMASFLITGLIIIEMALNIQGHFGYELLKQVLYNNYDVVIFYIYLIFLLVKITEYSVDSFDNFLKRKYAN